MEITDQIRRNANILDIASQYTTLRRSGRRYVGLCPFHTEKTPSFFVDEEKQLYHCFGCGAGGDLFTLVMEKENMSFPEVVRFLAEKYHIPMPERRPSSPRDRKLEEEVQKVTDQALAFFRRNLFRTQEGEKALAYAKKRGISEDTIERLKIGYALNSWDALVSAFQHKKVSPKLLEQAGLAVYHPARNSYYDRFRGRLIFPIFRESGKVVAFGGRSLFDAEPKYLNSPDTPIYTKGKLLYGLNVAKEAIRREGEVIFVEGYTDFIAMFQAGFLNTAASLGTSLTPEQVALAKRFARKMILCFDSDAAGKKAALRGVSLGFEKGMQTRVMEIPEGFDPDSYIRKHGPEACRSLLRSSVSGLTFLFRQHTQEADLAVPEEKSRVVRTIIEQIDKIPDPVVRSEALKKASHHFGVEESVLRALSRKKPEDVPKEGQNTFLPAEKYLLQVLFEKGDLAERVAPLLKEQDFRGLRSEPVFRMALAHLSRKKRVPEIHECKEALPSTLFRELSRVLMEKSRLATEEEALDCLNTLKMLALEKQGKEIDTEIRRLEGKGEEEKINALLEQRMEITRQLSLLSQRNACK